MIMRMSDGDGSGDSGICDGSDGSKVLMVMMVTVRMVMAIIVVMVMTTAAVFLSTLSIQAVT